MFLICLMTKTACQELSRFSILGCDRQQNPKLSKIKDALKIAALLCSSFPCADPFFSLQGPLCESAERFARHEEQAVLLEWSGKGNSAGQEQSTYWVWAHKRWHKTLLCHTFMWCKSFTSLDFRDLGGTPAPLQHSDWIALLVQGHGTRNRSGEIW